MKILLIITFLFSFAAQAEKCNDKKNVYKDCQDQTVLFKTKKDLAIKEKKVLLVKFGAEWCSWCLSLHKMFKSNELKAVMKNIIVSEIALYKDRDKIKTGQDVLAGIIKRSGKNVKMDGMPFLAVINPNNDKAAFISTAPLEQNTKTTRGHNSEKVIKALEKAKKEIL